MNCFKGRDVVSVNDFTNAEIEHILDVAEKMVPIARGEEKNRIMDGRVMASLFFEPSTRTRLSFEAAMYRLGGKVIGFSDASGTSVKKGETLADTIRMADAYSDVIAMRHPLMGSARLAAEFSKVPVLNGGDGAGQHPTQCLLDLFTIRSEKGKIGGNKVVLLGDLKYGRTVHSLTSALSRFGCEMTFVAPEQLQMPKEVINECIEHGVTPCLSTNLAEALADADVLYVTRIQKERFPDAAEYERVAGLYIVNKELLSGCKKDLIVMHPLPRVNEIHPDVDSTPHAAYFRQAFNGVPVRMALISLVLGAME
ncbi:MAG: aspartate carbamoyltransferase [Thermoplasmata archaeon HGW-Thermoplasmata-1]|nr:MAG: aspartate carbamoyltransferase [Thermoplasmata archaeon HGW-Thermoplasmata-1]